LTQGERIFEKGELGDCLYVIESGSVRVQDGERVLDKLSKHEFFGELSLLDAEPRSASVYAVERSRLFRLAQSDFYSLISERPDITQGINRVLCQMVRKANAA
jgi:CRP-like cAMP-binding protein